MYKKMEDAKLESVKNIHYISQNLLELGGISLIVYTTIVFCLIIGHETALFVCLLTFGIFVFALSTFDSIKGNSIIYIFLPWYFWISISFCYYTVAKEAIITRGVVFEVLLAIFFYLPIVIGSIKGLIDGNVLRIITLCVLLANIIPFEDWNAFYGLFFSAIRMLLLAILFVLQNFNYKYISHTLVIPDISTEKLKFFIQIEYVLFANIWFVITIAPIHAIYLSLQLFKSYNGSSSSSEGGERRLFRREPATTSYPRKPAVQTPLSDDSDTSDDPSSDEEPTNNKSHVSIPMEDDKEDVEMEDDGLKPPIKIRAKTTTTSAPPTTRKVAKQKSTTKAVSTSKLNSSSDSLYYLESLSNK